MSKLRPTYHNVVTAGRTLRYELREDAVLVFDDLSSSADGASLTLGELAFSVAQLESKHQKPVRIALMPPAEWFARGASGHDIFTRLLTSCLVLLGIDAAEARAAFDAAGMPSEFRSGLWACLEALSKSPKRDGDIYREFQEHLRMLTYSVMFSFESGLAWERLVEATAVRSLRTLFRRLDAHYHLSNELVFEEAEAGGDGELTVSEVLRIFHLSRGEDPEEHAKAADVTRGFALDSPGGPSPLTVQEFEDLKKIFPSKPES